MFFWAHSPLLGLINIVPQFVLILATIVSFARLEGLAALCLLPLAEWVAFAGVLCRDIAPEQLMLCTTDLRFFRQYCAAGFNFSSGKLSG